MAQSPRQTPPARRSSGLAFFAAVALSLPLTTTSAQQPGGVKSRTAALPPAKVKRATAAPEVTTQASARSEPAGAIGRGSILRLFAQANPMLWPLVLCSVVTLGYALERAVALRKERVVPREFVNRFLERLAAGKLDRDRATELCKAHESPVARVFGRVVSYWGQPASTIRQAVGLDAAGEVADLKRNIRVLNGTSTLAPLLGLLGTVVGMIQSFDALGGRTGTARGEALAHGISLALVATAMGLAIAVVSVAAYYYLLNRVDVLLRELDENARKAIDLVSAESSRPHTERRPTYAAGDPSRHESRAH